MKIITVTLAPNQAVLTCYLQDQSPKMPNAAIRPAMLVVPGGGYQYCSDREGEPVALAYMAQGFNAFVLRYTADATTPIDKALQDGAAAMDYLRANAAELEIDPQQIAAVGFSAGGHAGSRAGIIRGDSRIARRSAYTGSTRLILRSARITRSGCIVGSIANRDNTELTPKFDRRKHLFLRAAYPFRKYGNISRCRRVGA